MKKYRLAMGKLKSEYDSLKKDQITPWSFPEHLGRLWRVTFTNGKLTEAQRYESN